MLMTVNEAKIATLEGQEIIAQHKAEEHARKLAHVIEV